MDSTTATLRTVQRKLKDALERLQAVQDDNERLQAELDQLKEERGN